MNTYYSAYLGVFISIQQLLIWFSKNAHHIPYHIMSYCRSHEPELKTARYSKSDENQS